MGRCFLACLVALAVSAGAQEKKDQQPPPKSELQRDRKQQPTRQAVPEEEDKQVKEQEYSFNPLQAQREVQTGNYYFKKGSFRAAAGRFREATKWNEGYAEAWLRLGETEEKLKDPKEAREAYQKYLELASDGQKAPEVRKKLEKLK